MTDFTTPSGEEKKTRDAVYWAPYVSTLKVETTPTGALNLNVQGHQLAGALQGFGQMWQKTFRVRLEGADVTPAEVIKTWKERFAQFWPKGNHFYAPLTGIAPGEVGLINMRIPGDSPIGLPLSTGVLVIYADEESFTFMTPQGHVFAGWITFSAFQDEGCTTAQVQVLLRAFDFAYELGFRLGASKSENRFWEQTLATLAAHFGVKEAIVESQIVCIDTRVQWSQFWNIWHNSAIRTVLYRMATPVLVVRRRLVRVRTSGKNSA
jgi:hypothetical protein